MTETMQKVVLCVVGARPNFMKIAPIMSAFLRQGITLRPCLVHTGQHYDHTMSDQLFVQLGIPRPDVELEVGSGSHAVQTAEIMKRFEPVVDDKQPCAVLVVGDVNSTIACALVAAKKHVPVVHVEAGLRSYDRRMPEEINRVLTDQITDLFFITERSATENLMREGIASEKIHFVGNVMIDTLLAHVQRSVLPATTLAGVAGAERILSSKQGFALLTLHRPSNVDDAVVLRQLVETISKIAAKVPVVFPVHPRTAKHLETFGLRELLDQAGVVLLPALGYLELLGLMSKARLVLTDSGGIQEETTALGVPCITLRENTERPITVEHGTNTLVGADPQRIMAAFEDFLATGGKAGRVPELWDGHAAERIVDVLQKLYG